MKRYVNFALFFSVYGLAAGVYFREFTKINDFTGRTMLGMAHPHILILGLGFYLLLALFARVLNLPPTKLGKAADWVYICGLMLASGMMIFRGTLEVLGREITDGLSGMIAGLAGMGHIAVATGLILYLCLLKKHGN